MRKDGTRLCNAHLLQSSGKRGAHGLWSGWVGGIGSNDLTTQWLDTNFKPHECRASGHWDLLPSSLVYDACGLERELGTRGAADRVAEEGGAEPRGRVGNLRAPFCAAFDADAPIAGDGGVMRGVWV